MGEIEFPYSKGLHFFGFCLILYISLNRFSVILGRVSVDLSGTKQRIKCLTQRHNVVPPVRLEPATP